MFYLPAQRGKSVLGNWGFMQPHRRETNPET